LFDGHDLNGVGVSDILWTSQTRIKKALLLRCEDLEKEAQFWIFS